MFQLESVGVFTCIYWGGRVSHQFWIWDEHRLAWLCEIFTGLEANGCYSATVRYLHIHSNWILFQQRKELDKIIKKCLEEAQPSCQNKMLAGDVSANYWFIHILHLSFVVYHTDISKIHCIACRHYRFMTFLLEGGGNGGGVTGHEAAKPLTVVQDCVSTIANVKPLDSLWRPLESFWPVCRSKNGIFLTGSWVIFSFFLIRHWDISNCLWQTNQVL